MTMISHSRKFIFVRPYKVASTSILTSLAPLCKDDDVLVIDPVLDAFDPTVDDDGGELRMRNAHVFADLSVSRMSRGVHILPERIKKTVGDGVWDEYFKFTVVRNPWDWFVSFYYYRIRVNWPKDILAARRLLIDARTRYRLRRVLPNFEIGRHKENIEFILKKNYFAKQIAAMPKFYFVDGRQYAAYYIRFENLDRGYDEVRRLLQLPRQSLPKRKSRTREKKSDYRDYYTDWSRAYIARRFRQIIDAFGYRF